jgi:streptogramin lyase
MKTRRLLLVASAGLALIACQTGGDPLRTGAGTRVGAAAALAGRVASIEEGAMEGVVVSARKAGSTVTISVVSDAQGAFSFPPTKLESGRHSLRIRATGYELDGPGSVDVSAGMTATVDLKLRKVKDITSQMTNAEWIASVPGTPDQKKFLYGCVGCHTLERVVKSNHDAAGFVEVMKRMAGYTNNSHIERPQLRVRARDPMRDFGPDADRQAAYLATINLSSGSLSYPLRTLARAKGRAARVLITEYELPRKLMPHDVIVDSDGIVWISQFDEQFLGKFDPKTLKYVEFAVPAQRPGFAKGTLDLEVDPQGNLWLSHMFQSGIVKFDRKTEKFQAWPLPPGVVNDNSQQSMVGPQRWTVDGKVWLNDAGIPGLHRLDMATGKFETWKPYEKLPKGPHSVYGIYADSRNNIFFMDFGGESVGKIEAKTGAVTLYPTPTPRSRPRRGRMDDQDRVWFAEWRAEKIGMFDTKTEKFREWPVPTPYTAPYDVVLDKTGKVWTAGMNTDRVLRMDLETGEFTEYPLPSQTNIRRVFVDNSTTPPTFWVGNNHHATVVKVEPMD